MNENLFPQCIKDTVEMLKKEGYGDFSFRHCNYPRMIGPLNPEYYSVYEVFCKKGQVHMNFFTNDYKLGIL